MALKRTDFFVVVDVVVSPIITGFDWFDLSLFCGDNVFPAELLPPEPQLPNSADKVLRRTEDETEPKLPTDLLHKDDPRLAADLVEEL
jgi:hypothetical protein